MDYKRVLFLVISIKIWCAYFHWNMWLLDITACECLETGRYALAEPHSTTTWTANSMCWHETVVRPAKACKYQSSTLALFLYATVLVEWGCWLSYCSIKRNFSLRIYGFVWLLHSVWHCSLWTVSRHVVYLHVLWTRQRSVAHHAKTIQVHLYLGADTSKSTYLVFAC